VSLDIRPGETFGLLGPNGAGKTTTLSMLATLLPPTSGDASVGGCSVARDPKGVRRRVGIAPQTLSLYPDLTGEENLHFFARLNGVPRREREARVAHVLALVGLEGRRADRVRSYSGGMQRRLNLACALVHGPRVVLLDEPTAGVDPQSRENLLGAIRGLAADGTTVLYTTHYMEEAERLCDRIAILDEGRVRAVGTLEELLEIVGLGEVIEVRGAGLGRLGGGARGLSRQPGARLHAPDRSLPAGLRRRMRRSPFPPALLLAAVASAAAAAIPAAPVEAVRQTLTRASDAASADAPREARLAALRVAARELVDTRSMGREALGPALDAQPPAWRDEFLEHFDVLIVRTWMQKLLFFRDPRFVYGGAEDRDGATWVPTRIQAGGEFYHVDYRMGLQDGRWWATDIEIEGMSLVESYRAQLASLLERNSFEELLELLRVRTRRLQGRGAR
jgi:ABC-2 type transport system ATP-binding protein